MASTLTIELGLPPRELCGNGPPPASRGAKIGRSRAVRAQREAAWQAATAAILAQRDPARRRALPQFPGGRVRVDVLVRRDPTWSARRLDDDNLIRGLKAALDGLSDAGVWADDRQVRYGHITWEPAEPLRGAVVLTLTGEA
jgi:Holliday junction resolvase RusA-like endonuclease